MRLNQDVSSIFCNGHKDPYIFCNGVQVWPSKVVTSHSIYLDFDQGVTDNMTFQGLWWNGSQITESMVAEASYKSGNTWTSISASDLTTALLSSFELTLSHSISSSGEHRHTMLLSRKSLSKYRRTLRLESSMSDRKKSLRLLTPHSL